MTDPITDPADSPSDDNLVDGRPGDDRPDAGAEDTTLTTDDDAQREGDVADPENS
ncbi:hypothetical protein [Klenkia brasiliensis]|uniref:Uncharacterized protein n=1 Tax=Klenkia brasiliensis TaxID=333142 RepID=A0A1G7Q5G3_9ACTN|nr:hypothetical protein [Klenkia brasiliensis]SDF93179.1 hypothetical protein SAMN05660324_1338 [Klenkia brasiliensis]